MDIRRRMMCENPPIYALWYYSPSKISIPSSGTNSYQIRSQTFNNGFGAVFFKGPVTTLPSWFSGTSVTRVILSEMFTTINNSAFANCSALESIEMPGVTTIEAYAFRGCTKLSITIPESIISIGSYAFQSCYGDIFIDNYLITSNYSTTASFLKSSSFSHIVLGDSVTSIGDYVFNGLSFTSCTFGKNVKKIGKYAFNQCKGDIIIPESVTSIGRAAFQITSGEITVNCNIPSVSSYSDSPFYYTNATKIIFGESVKSIGAYAFCGCHCTDITSKSTTAPTIKSTTFQWIESNGTLYYPAGSDYSSWLSTSSYYLGYYGWTGKSIITFTIDGTEYQAVDGMTWEEWISSEYNTSSRFSIISGVVAVDGGKTITASNVHDAELATNVILATSYRIQTAEPVNL